MSADSFLEDVIDALLIAEKLAAITLRSVGMYKSIFRPVQFSSYEIFSKYLLQ